MKPVAKKHTNFNLPAPPNWDEKMFGSCEQLPICISDNMMYSYWKPCFSEKLKILFGRKVRLVVFGTKHPAVAIDTEKI